MKRFRNEGVAIVFVSHHLPAVAQLCNRALLLEHGSPVRLGSPPEVIAEYCRGGGVTDLDDVRIGAMLRTSSEQEAPDVFQVPAGDQLRLEVTVEFRVDVERATLGIVVWDLTRNLYVYGASSDFVGVPPIRARAGDLRTFDFTFEANLTRGLYALEINVVDPDRHRFLGVARGIRQFHVVEQVSYDGIANLYLAGHESDAVREPGGVRAALAR
jgi:lipopolysaccharide transport system ATP-binding protein